MPKRKIASENVKEQVAEKPKRGKATKKTESILQNEEKSPKKAKAIKRTIKKVKTENDQEQEQPIRTRLQKAQAANRIELDTNKENNVAKVNQKSPKKTNTKKIVDIELKRQIGKRTKISEITDVPNKAEKSSEIIVENIKQDTEKESKSDENVNKRSRIKRGKSVTKNNVDAQPSNNKRIKIPTNITNTDYKSVSFECKKRNARGEAYNLKISSWNVNGLRSWLENGGLEFLENENPDIFCVQETKCSDSKVPEEIKNIKGYHTYWCGGKKETSAGVAIFTKIQPLNVNYGIGEKQYDEEGRCITAEIDTFYLVNVYVPNAGRKLVTLPKRLEWNNAFKAYIKELDKKKPVILCGDMNVAHNEIDLTNPKTNTKNAGFTNEEREGMSEFLADGYVDTFRNLYPDRKDAYTFWSHMHKARTKNIGWRLDYFIVSDRIMDRVCDNQIRHQVYGSNHCPITIYLHV